MICVLPGNTDRIILVGAHTDKVNVGDGVVDNWSGASLLPSLLYSVSGEARQHTFVFVGFTAEETGMLGSAFYAEKLSKEQTVEDRRSGQLRHPRAGTDEGLGDAG